MDFNFLVFLFFVHSRKFNVGISRLVFERLSHGSAAFSCF